MLKKISFIIIASIASFNASAETVTCEFDDGLGWEINTDSVIWAAYYVGYCRGQGGASDIQ